MKLLEAARQALPGVAWDPQTTYNGATWLTGVGSVDLYNVFDLGDITWLGADLRNERDAIDADLGETPRSTLTEELAALREANRWIPVGDDVPADCEDVLVWNGEPRQGWLDTDSGWFKDSDGGKLHGVTHWRPMPAPPEPEAAPTR